MIRVLVVDDSALMRKMLSQILSADPEIEVIDTAMDGGFALEKIRKLRPDVITLDVDMPGMNGIETLKQIVEEFGIPTIIVSSLAQRDAETTFQALEIGAFDFVTKPQSSISVHIKDISHELVVKVKAAYENPVARLKLKKIEVFHPSVQKEQAQPSGAPRHVLAIGVSTGGPNALSYLLPRLPRSFPAAIVIVQHMPALFTEMFAARLNALSHIEVKEARDGDLVVPGRALIAPGDRHLKIKRLPLGTIAVLGNAPPVHGHKPSVDVLFRSVAAEFGRDSAGLIMTGMGSDGAQGIGEIMQKRGVTIAQDEKSCAVFGMPRAAIEKNHIHHVISLEEIADFLINLFCREEKQYGTVRC